MTLSQFVKDRKALFWSIRNPIKLSDAAIVETILNYGDFNDVKQLFKVMSTKKVARIFTKQVQLKRHNYRPEIKHYFRLYFQKYAS